MQYDNSDVFSRVSWNGSYEIDEVRSVYVPIPGINPTDGGAGVTGGAEVHLGLWLPVIEGCDWDAGSVVEGCQVPVIAEIGPYYDDGDVDALAPALHSDNPLTSRTDRFAFHGCSRDAKSKTAVPP